MIHTESYSTSNVLKTTDKQKHVLTDHKIEVQELIRILSKYRLHTEYSTVWMTALHTQHWMAAHGVYACQTTLGHGL